jgi:hypothetical protein
MSFFGLHGYSFPEGLGWILKSIVWLFIFGKSKVMSQPSTPAAHCPLPALPVHCSCLPAHRLPTAPAHHFLPQSLTYQLQCHQQRSPLTAAHHPPSAGYVLAICPLTTPRSQSVALRLLMRQLFVFELAEVHEYQHMGLGTSQSA